MNRVRGKPVESIDEADLKALLENGVAESRVLEYKASLPKNSDSDKKEFLADVTAFANTVGGVIIFGVATGNGESGADSGIPVAIDGLPGINPDQEKLRLLGMLQDGVRPALSGAVSISSVVLAGSGAPVLALGIPRSLAAPHMVSFQRTNRFWRRSESNKYLPDVAEVRRMFLEAQSWGAEAEDFRSNRVRTVRAGEIVPGLAAESSLFIHILPVGRLDTFLDLRPFERVILTKCPPPGSSGSNFHFNLDGFFSHTGAQSRPTGYSQFFRFGGIEGYMGEIVRERPNTNSSGHRFFYAEYVAGVITAYVAQALDVIGNVFRLEPPYALMVSVEGVKDSYVPESDYYMGGDYRISRDHVHFPPLLLSDADPVNAVNALEPLLDVLWQAAGMNGRPKKSPGGNVFVR